LIGIRITDRNVVWKSELEKQHYRKTAVGCICAE